MTKFREATCRWCGSTFFAHNGRGPVPQACPPCKRLRDTVNGLERQRRLRRKGKRMTPRTAALPARSRGHPAEAIGLEDTTSQRPMQIPPNDRGRGWFAKEGGRDLSPLPCSTPRITEIAILTIQEFTREYFK